MLKYSQDEQGAVLVIAVVFAFIVSLLGISYFRMGGLEGGLVQSRLNASQALYCADAGIEYAKFRLRDAGEWVSPNNWGNISVGGMGTTEVELIYSNAEWKIISTGRVGNITPRRVEAIVEQRDEREDILTAVNGLVSLAGSINIDGRNHDGSTGVVITNGTGTAALTIPTDITVQQIIDEAKSSSCTLGGTVNGVDYAPINPKDNPDFNQGLIQQSPVVYPSPHEVLGFETEEDLRQKARDVGTYYNVNTEGVPSGMVVSGLTYIDFTGSGETEWTSPPSGEGILIIHSDDGDGVTVKPFNEEFKGIFIVDNLENLHGTILGALYVFNKARASLGNGGGNILFSRELIRNMLIDGTYDIPPKPKPVLASWREL